MAENTTIDIGSGEELDPSSWDRVLFCMAGLSPGHSFNKFMPPVAALYTTIHNVIEIIMNKQKCVLQHKIAITLTI